MRKDIKNATIPQIILSVLVMFLINVMPEVILFNLMIVGVVSAAISYCTWGRVNFWEVFCDIAYVVILMTIGLLSSILFLSVLSTMFDVLATATVTAFWTTLKKKLYKNNSTFGTAIYNAIPGSMVSLISKLQLFYGWGFWFLIMLIYVLYEVMIKGQLTLSKGIVICIYTLFLSWMIIVVPSFSNIMTINLLCTITLKKLSSVFYSSTIKELDAQ